MSDRSKLDFPVSCAKEAELETTSLGSSIVNTRGRKGEKEWIPIVILDVSLGPGPIKALARRRKLAISRV